MDQPPDLHVSRLGSSSRSCAALQRGLCYPSLANSQDAGQLTQGNAPWMESWQRSRILHNSCNSENSGQAFETTQSRHLLDLPEELLLALFDPHVADSSRVQVESRFVTVPTPTTNWASPPALTQVCQKLRRILLPHWFRNHVQVVA